LPVMPSHSSTYVLTDLSQHFLTAAQRQFAPYSFVQYQALDIDKDPIEQGLAPNSFDVIVASGVLHATKSLKGTLDRSRRPLAPGGTLMLVELTRTWLLSTISFGLTKGWWSFEDEELRHDEPAITCDEWCGLLTDTGFENAAAFTDSPDKEASQHALILARAPGSATVASNGSGAKTTAGGVLALSDL